MCLALEALPVTWSERNNCCLDATFLACQWVITTSDVVVAVAVAVVAVVVVVVVVVVLLRRIVVLHSTRCGRQMCRFWRTTFEASNFGRKVVAIALRAVPVSRSSVVIAL